MTHNVLAFPRKNLKVLSCHSSCLVTLAGESRSESLARRVGDRVQTLFPSFCGHLSRFASWSFPCTRIFCPALCIKSLCTVSMSLLHMSEAPLTKVSAPPTVLLQYSTRF